MATRKPTKPPDNVKPPPPPPPPPRPHPDAMADMIAAVTRRERYRTLKEAAHAICAGCRAGEPLGGGATHLSRRLGEGNTEVVDDRPCHAGAILGLLTKPSKLVAVERYTVEWVEGLLTGILADLHSSEVRDQIEKQRDALRRAL